MTSCFVCSQGVASVGGERQFAGPSLHALGRRLQLRRRFSREFQHLRGVPLPGHLRQEVKCDASGAIANGALGPECSSTLAIGLSCAPTCDEGYVSSGSRSCQASAFSDDAECVSAPCDASAAPTNGAVGNCTSSLPSGSTCQPTCDTGYIVSGQSSCGVAGALTAADCRELSCCERTFDKFGFGVAYSYGDDEL